jgi:signal transduction histidine kinase
MGGDLTMKSEFGKGSRFTVTLPTDTQRRKIAAARLG